MGSQARKVRAPAPLARRVRYDRCRRLGTPDAFPRR
jgi:hypothetical protein